MIKRYPLSHSQKLLLLEQLYDIESTHLNIGGYLLIDGIINPVLWEKAVNLVCEENEILRTSFVRNDDGVYFQEVQESLNSAIIKDFSAEPEDDSICLEWIQQRFNVPFEIDGGKLYELGLLLTSSKSYFYSIYNHLIADGWSVALAAKKIITKYELLINEVSIMNEDNSTFIDDINKSKEYFCSSKYKIDRQYWRDKAKSVRDYSWDISYKKREKKVAKSSARELEISKDYYANIIEFCNKNNLITFHFFLAVFSLMLKLRTSSNKVLFNVRIQNRATKREKENLGSYSSIIPLSVDLENRNFLNIFESIRNELNRGYKHRKCCMEEFYPSVVVEGNIDLSGAIVVSYEPFDYNYTVGGFIAEALTLPSGSVAESVDVHIREFHKNNRVFISSYFDENLFDNVEPDIFIEQFNLIVKRIVIEGINNINQLLGITSLEKSILDKMNNTEKILLKDNLCSVLEDVLFSNPLAVAVICKGEKHFYKELYSEAYKVVGFLQSYGIRLGDRISVSMDYSFEMIVVMTGIILGGAVFVPISNKDPLQRRGRIVSDSQSKILITDKICDLSCKQFLIKDVLISKENIHQEKVFLDENADCYIVYTSGSTGEPKGVINTHKGSVNILEEWKEKYEIVGERFVLLQTSSFAHDVFIGNYLKTIATGGILVLPTEEERYDLGELSCLLSNNKVNVLDSTPSLILMLVDYIERNNIDDSSLKLIIVGSDICSLEDFKKLLSKYGERAVVVNSYGVSEAAIYTTDYLAKKVDELPMFGNLPIGKPFRNIKMYVLDDQLRQVSLGVEGELFIAGYGLAKGYTSIALTREKFINLDGIGRVYRTGDMARILSDGNIQFIGRKDFQIKIRGYRIEPGDIESCMESIDGISKAVIVSPEINGNKVLVAYYNSFQEIPQNELLAKMRLSLPSYMIPNFFQKLDSIPLSPNGKVDRKALISLPISVPDQNIQSLSSDEAKESVKRVWVNILGEKFSSDCAFVSMGADSLEAIKIASELNVLGYKCSYLDIYKSFSFDDFYSTYIDDEKIDDILFANQVLEKVFGQGVVIENVHHSKLQKRVIELNTDLEKKFLDYEKIIEFCHDRFDFSLQPQYFSNKEYIRLDEMSAKNLLSELFRSEGLIFKEFLSKEKRYRLVDPLYSFDLRKFYRNKYFVSKVRIASNSVNNVRRAVADLMNKNDLLRACLVKTGLDKYAWDIFDECNYEIPCLDLSGYEVFSSYDFIYNVLSEYYINKNEYRKFLFRAIVVKINLSETFLWYFMDDSIHDDYGNQLIDSYLLEVAKSGYKDYPTTASYQDFLNKVIINKYDNEEKLICDLSLDDFNSHTKMYASFIKKMIASNPSSENFSYKFKLPQSSVDELSLALEVFTLFARYHFPFTKVPIVFLHNTRFFSSEEFVNSIGAFIDEVPLIINTELNVEANLNYIKSSLAYVNSHGIHFKNILLNTKFKNKKLQQKVKKIVGKLAETDSLLFFNFKQGDIQIDELFSESDELVINRWLKGIRFVITIMSGSCEVFIRFPYAVNSVGFREYLNKSFTEIIGEE